MRLERLQAIADEGVALDTETHQIQNGLLAPPLVCGSVAIINVDVFEAYELASTLEAQGRSVEAHAIRSSVEGRDSIESELLEKQAALDLFLQLLRDPNKIIVGANIAYDLLVLANEWAKRGFDCIPLIFRAFQEQRIYDLQIAEALHAIANGHLNDDPRTGKPLVNAVTKKKSLYSLAMVVDLVLGRTDAKENDYWRRRYAELEHIPQEQWPVEAREYPKDDSRNTIEAAAAQCGHLPKTTPHHVWGKDGCEVCGAVRFGEMCIAKVPHRNLYDHANQVWTAFCLHLGAAWGFHVDQKKVDVIEKYAIKKRAAGITPFIEAGVIRPEGSVNQGVLKKLIAKAYGASAPCELCEGTGKRLAPNPRMLVCKTCRGRSGPWKGGGTINPATVFGCKECGDVGKVVDVRHRVTCRADDGSVSCDGTGLELADTMPRSDTGLVPMSADTCFQAGDEFVMSYGHFTADGKWLKDYVPFLRKARREISPGCGKWFDIPLTLQPNPILDTGRVSYRGYIQLFPRWPGFFDQTDPEHKTWVSGGRTGPEPSYIPSFREAIVARPGYVLSSEDFRAGELVTHAQSCKWLVGFSDLGTVLLSKDANGKAMDPHSMLASTVLGVPYEELIAAIKSNRRFSDARQASKCFHPDTEALTRRGWVRIGDLTYEDDVAAAIPGAEGVAIEWQKPTDLTRRPSPGSLIHLKNEGMDLRVTDDHRMLVRGGSGLWKTVTPAEVPRARTWYNAGACATGDWAPDQRILQLAVATQADGSFRNLKIAFGFSKQRKIDRLEALLFPGEYVKRVTSQGATQFVLEREITAKIRALLDDEKQLTWQWIDLTPALREVVLDEVPFWDGHKAANWRMYQYFTTRPRNSDVLQALATISNRKTRQVDKGRQQQHHNDVRTLTVRAKPETRGENLACDRVSYEGEVVCLSVPSSYIVVRDGGIPVVVGQCLNFGKPGGMGDAKLVLQQRRGGPDTPHPTGPVWIEDEDGNLVRGYKGLRFCLRMGGDGPCGRRMTYEFKNKPISPVCSECLERAVELGAKWTLQWREAKPYFNFASRCVEEGQIITFEMLERWPHLQDFYEAGHQLAAGEIMQHVSGRVRGGLNFMAAANGWFQGLLADVTKEALRRISWECYDRTLRVPSMLYANSLVSKYAGIQSPLFGSRPIVFQHDEVIAEHPVSIASDAAFRLSEVMRDCLRYYCPDYADAAAAEPTLMPCWSKSAAMIIHNDRLVPWTKAHNPKKCSECKEQADRDAARICA